MMIRNFVSRLLAGFLLTLSSPAQLVYSPTPSHDTLDLDVVHDQSGRAHLLLARNTPDGSALDYHFFDGIDWQQGASVTTSNSSDQLYGLDLAVDQNGVLHATFLDGYFVYYATKDPNETSWTLELIAGNAGSSELFDHQHLQTSLTLRGSDPRVTYNANSGLSDILLFYATRSSEGIWTSEPITGPTMAVYPVIANGSIPQPETESANRGPVIAYYENGKYWLTQRVYKAPFDLDPGFEGWTNPIELSDPLGSNSSTSGLRSDLQFHNGILHFLARSMNPDTGFSGLIYHRWEHDGGPGETQKTYEHADGGLMGGDDTVLQLAMSLSSGGQPQCAFASRDLNHNWTFAKTKRLGDDFWSGETLLTGAFGTPSPQCHAISSDAFGRTTAATSFRKVDGNSLDTRILQESDLKFSKKGFPLTGRTTVEKIPGSLNIDQDGNIGYAYLENEGLARFRFVDTKSGVSQTTDLTSFFSETEIDRTVLDLESVAIGDRYHFVFLLTTYREVGSPANLRYRITRSTFRDGGYISGAELEQGLASWTHPPELAVSSDGGFFHLGIHSFGTLPVYYKIRPDGSGTIGFLSDFFPNTELRDVKNDARNGALAIIGHNDEGLLVHFRNSAGEWNTEFVQTSAETIRPGYDLEILPGGDSYYVTFADEDHLYLATSIRPAIGPPSDTLPRLILAGETDEVLTQVSTQDNGELHFVFQVSDAGQAAVFYQRYLGYPLPDQSNLLSTEILTLNAGAPSFGEDQFGSPVMIANDLTLAPSARMIFRSPLTIDADCDGLPLFMELALDRDPHFAEHDPILDIDAEIVAGEVVSTLSFNRPPAPAIATRDGIEAGNFVYHLGASATLKTFNNGLIAHNRTPAPSAPANGEWTSGYYRQKIIYENRLPGTLKLHKHFFRLRIYAR